jgi:hypothetical protein
MWNCTASVRTVCMAVWEAMSNRFIPTPNEGKWRSIAQGFNKHANFPTCGSGRWRNGWGASLYFNYKHYCSVVLLAVADSNFRFVYADAGSYGKGSDASIFRNSSLWQKTSAQAVTNTLNQRSCEQLQCTLWNTEAHGTASDVRCSVTEQVQNATCVAINARWSCGRVGMTS